MIFIVQPDFSGLSQLIVQKGGPLQSEMTESNRMTTMLYSVGGVLITILLIVLVIMTRRNVPKVASRPPHCLHSCTLHNSFLTASVFCNVGPLEHQLVLRWVKYSPFLAKHRPKVAIFCSQRAMFGRSHYKTALVLHNSSHL